jgi:hypothetical protein
MMASKNSTGTPLHVALTRARPPRECGFSLARLGAVVSCQAAALIGSIAASFSGYWFTFHRSKACCIRSHDSGVVLSSRAIRAAISGFRPPLFQQQFRYGQARYPEPTGELGLRHVQGG